MVDYHKKGVLEMEDHRFVIIGSSKYWSFIKMSNSTQRCFIYTWNLLIQNKLLHTS